MTDFRPGQYVTFLKDDESEDGWYRAGDLAQVRTIEYFMSGPPALHVTHLMRGGVAPVITYIDAEELALFDMRDRATVERWLAE